MSICWGVGSGSLPSHSDRTDKHVPWDRSPIKYIAFALVHLQSQSAGVGCWVCFVTVSGSELVVCNSS